jgi:NADH-quinone oxidoreductase subunit A
MKDSLIPVLMLLLTAAGVAGALLVITHGVDWLRRSRSKVGRWFGPDSPVDTTPYECGMKPYESINAHRFSVHFYLVAMLFILFDIEVAFLFPWAVTFNQFAADKVFVLVEMAVFLGILIAGFIYIWARGALEWD